MSDLVVIHELVFAPQTFCLRTPIKLGAECTCAWFCGIALVVLATDCPVIAGLVVFMPVVTECNVKVRIQHKHQDEALTYPCQAQVVEFPSRRMHESLQRCNAKAIGRHTPLTL